MNNIITQDVCEVYLRNIATGVASFFGITTKNEVTQKIKQELQKAGIGSKAYGMIQSDKEMGFKVTTLYNNDDLIAMQVGKAMASGTATVQKNEEIQLKSGKLTLQGTPKTGTTKVLVLDKLGKALEGTYATNAVTITGGTEGAYYTVVYPMDVTGTVLDLNAESFPENYYVELHTIGFDPDTNQVACDIYWIFEKATPNGSLQKAYELGKSNGEDIEFTAQVPIGGKSYGKYLVVPRV